MVRYYGHHRRDALLSTYAVVFAVFLCVYAWTMVQDAAVFEGVYAATEENIESRQKLNASLQEYRMQRNGVRDIPGEQVFVSH
jgi:hypothetical protein